MLGMLEMFGSQTDFYFSFDIVPSIDMVLYFGELVGGHGRVWKRLETRVQVEKAKLIFELQKQYDTCGVYILERVIQILNGDNEGT